MANVRHRLERRRKAAQVLEELRHQVAVANVIHYSCESFYDQTKAGSRRITSIAIRHVESAQTQSFSIQLEAERTGVAPDDIVNQFDKLESAMLSDFYKFLKEHAHFYWIHWNMRNINYGFSAIEHRSHVLKVKTTPVNADKLIDLSALLLDEYGTHYAQHRRLTDIINLNDLDRSDLLPGDEEAAAFERGEFLRLHQSTLAKVDALSSILRKLMDGTLRTRAGWKDRYGSSIVGLVDTVADHWAYKVAGGIGIIASIISVPLAIISLT